MIQAFLVGLIKKQIQQNFVLAVSSTLVPFNIFLDTNFNAIFITKFLNKVKKNVKIPKIIFYLRI